MKLINQHDSCWSYKTIGKSKSTIGAYGCLITCLSMLSDWYKDYKDPAWMAKSLNFTPNGLLYWKSITDSKLPIKFIWRFYGYNESYILPALGGKTTSCVLQVRGNHWVVGIKKVGSYYYIADPWDGTRKFINKSIISGGATLDAK